MSHVRWTVLLIEDCASDARLLATCLKQELGSRLHLDHVARLATGLRQLAKTHYHAVLLDLGLPDSAGLAAVEAIQACGRGTPIVVVSGCADEDVALRAVRQGAQDYVVKEKTNAFQLARSVLLAMERASSERRLAPPSRIEDGAPFRAELAALSPRERQISELIADGRPLKQIAKVLGTSYYTVKNQRAAILRKLDVESEADLIRHVLLSRMKGNDTCT